MGPREGRAGAPPGPTGVRVGAEQGRALGREGGRREEERGTKRKLTSGLDDRRQPLTGIPPRARGGGGEVEERKREVAAWEKKNEKERGWGRTWGERVARGAPVTPLVLL